MPSWYFTSKRFIRRKEYGESEMSFKWDAELTPMKEIEKQVQHIGRVSDCKAALRKFRLD